MYDHIISPDNRDKALEMVEEGRVTADHLLLCCLKYMSNDDVYDMLAVSYTHLTLPTN